MTADCSEYTPLLSAAADGVLSPEEQSRLADHLACCPACRERYAQTLLIHETLSAWEAPEPPGDLTAAVMARIRSERAVRRKRRRCAAALAACFTLLLFSARLLPPMGKGSSDAVSADTGGAAEYNEAALYDSAAEGAAPSATPELREAEPKEPEQVLQGASTFFNAPQTGGGADAETDKAAADAPAVVTLSSSDPELLSWMTSNISPEARCSQDEDAWLITADEYQALNAHIEEAAIDCEMEWGSFFTAAAVPEENQAIEEEKEMICVIYLQAGEPEETPEEVPAPPEPEP